MGDRYLWQGYILNHRFHAWLDTGKDPEFGSRFHHGLCFSIWTSIALASCCKGTLVGGVVEL